MFGQLVVAVCAEIQTISARRPTPLRGGLWAFRRGLGGTGVSPAALNHDRLPRLGALQQCEAGFAMW